ncbi:MAG: glycoside hydrolase family 127 protein, partial [Lewinella sp.]|nr:glycoside hydrolase family 127 protein [Lewinella sp.]
MSCLSMLLVFCLTLFTQLPAQPAFEAFPLSRVRLMPGILKDAESRDRTYLLSLDPDRLLAPFREEAGLSPRKPPYGNWEGSGLGGHTAGHYLSALAMMYASTGDTLLRDRLHYMIDELALCQAESADGYVGGVPDGAALWADVAAGRIDAGSFSLNGKWVPWYNLHKLFAGLRDAYLHAGSEQALDMLVKLSDWALGVTDDLTDEQMQEMLRAEHGGMNEVLADLAAITGEDKYMQLARRFSDERILRPLEEDRDALTGLHANTQIPKVIGYARIGELAGLPDWWEAARFFWQTVVEHRTVAIGGNSVREHFHATDDFSSMIEEVQGPETCNTYNMLRLSKILYLRSGQLPYIDYYERALYNHILSSQHPKHGGLVYFTPMRPGHYRVYSQPEENFWCCVGSGMENHAKYGELIYAHGGADTLAVNLFVPSQLNWEAQGVTVWQLTRFPEEETSRLYFEMTEPRAFTLLLRYPAWAPAGELVLELNGEPVAVDASPGEYITLDRTWAKGDEVALTMPMPNRVEMLPDGSAYGAILHGPIVLAAETSIDGL